MLGKLLKHEFKANFRVYAPTVAIFFAVALVIRVMSFFKPEDNIYLMISYQFLSIVFIIGLYGLTLYAIFGNVSRFKKNLFSDEGYLMHTLPIPSYYHILAKLICGIVFLMIGFFTTFACIMLAFLGGSDILEIAEDLIEVFLKVVVPYPLESILVAILTFVIYCSFILLCYTTTAISNFAQKGKKTISALMIIGAIIINNIFFTLLTNISDTILKINSVSGILLVYIFYFLLVSVGFFFAVNTIINKHLNLE